MRIEADTDLCIGSGNCTMISEVLFDQDDDGVVEVLVENVPDDEVENARQAVKLCPASVLKLLDG